MALHHNPRIVTDGLVSIADTQTPSPSGKVYDPISGGYLTVSGATIGDQYNGITFNGTSDYASGDSTYSNAFNFGTGDFTVELWIKQHTVQSSWRGIWVKGSSGTQGFALLKYGDSGTKLSTSIDAPDNTHFSNSDGDFSSHLGKWVHACTTWDRDGNAKIYFNGIHTATNGISGQSGTVNGNTVYLASWQGSSWFWDGQLDSIKGYNRILSANEVLQNYNAQRVRFGL